MPDSLPLQNTTPYNSEDNNKNKKFYILAGAFLVVILLLTGGIFYMDKLGIRYEEKSDTPTRSAASENPNITTAPSSGTQSAELSSDLVQRYNEVVKNSAVTLATSHTVYEGKISEIDTRGGFEERLNLQYALMLKIEGKGTIVSQIYFSQQDMGHLTILQKTGEQETPLAISSFKVGDPVILDFTTDALRSNYDNMISGKLTKL